MPREEDEGFVIEFTPDPEFVNLMKETQSGLIEAQKELQLALDALNETREAGDELVEAANRVLSIVPKTEETDERHEP